MLAEAAFSRDLYTCFRLPTEATKGLNGTYKQGMLGELEWKNICIVEAHNLAFRNNNTPANIYSYVLEQMDWQSSIAMMRLKQN